MTEEKFTGFFMNTGGSIQKSILGISSNVSTTSHDIVIVGEPCTATTGYITDNYDGESIPVAGAKVSFIKDYQVLDKQKSTYTGNKIIYDYAVTDKQGKYVVFLEPGTYTVRVDCSKYPEYYVNKVVENGLNAQYYRAINYCMISKRLDDTLYLLGDDRRIVQGTMTNEYGKPVADASIVITSGEEVITFIKTDKDGKYRFCIANGIYDIRIRSKLQSVDITRGFVFDDTHGFFVNAVHEEEV